MVTIFDTSSVDTNIDIVRLCMYTSRIYGKKRKSISKN
jgi:hypothetical protein